MTIQQYFPTNSKIKEPRPQQITVFDDIVNLHKDGKTKFCLVMPTGSGKSSESVALMNYFKNEYNYRSCVTSPLNNLVDQYYNDFENDYEIKHNPHLNTLKGRKHYKCIANGKTADVGYCKQKVCTINPDSSRNCEYCTIKSECPCMNNCIYKKAVDNFVKSPKCNTNFTLFLINQITNDPTVIIVDENDEAESFIRLHNTITIPEIIDWDSFEDHVITLEWWQEHYQKQIEITERNILRTKKQYAREQLLKDLNHLEQLEKRITKLINDYTIHKEPWSFKLNHNSYTTTYEPITTTRFVEPLFNDKIVIQMSATPPKNMPRYHYIEVDSPFPIEIRPWQYKPFGSMTMKHRDKTIPKLAQFLSTLEHKTLVHCVSYPTAMKIGKALINIGIDDVIIQVGNGNLGDKEAEMITMGRLVKRKDVITKFKESDNPNQVLLSVKLETGTDFPELDILNNVIAVLNWPNPTDALTKAKRKMYGLQKSKQLENENMAKFVQQSYGRINRNFDKTTMTYITCSSFGGWYKRNKSHFYKWFTNAQVKS